MIRQADEFGGTLPLHSGRQQPLQQAEVARRLGARLCYIHVIYTLVVVATTCRFYLTRFRLEAQRSKDLHVVSYPGADPGVGVVVLIIVSQRPPVRLTGNGRERAADLSVPVKFDPKAVNTEGDVRRLGDASRRNLG